MTDTHKLLEAMARAIYAEADKTTYVGTYKFHGADTSLDGQFDLCKLARAALTAIEASGYRVVPVEPTEDQKQIARMYFNINPFVRDGDPLDHLWLTAYTAMLAAVPKVTP